jgi:bifunctional non-homologous end joining protein LigD
LTSRPKGADWIHEIKHDGYRTMLVLERGKACAYTRNGHDWSDRYSGIIRAAVKHPCRAAILDGLRDHLLVERRAKLQTLLRSDPESPIQFSEELIGDASAFFGACAAHELQRIVSKLATSRYRSGRSKTWLKTKCFTESEFFLLGIDRDRKTEAPRALLAKSERGQFIMQDQLSSRFVQQHARSSAPGSQNSNKNVRCFLGCGIEMHIGSDPNSHLR